MRGYVLTLALLALAGTAQAQQAAPSTSPSSNSMLYGKPVAVTPLSPEILSSDAYKALVADLRRGGYVIYLRHALTVSAPEPAVGDLADCTWQRNLSDDGRRQAASVGSRLSEQGIPVAALEASPFCRTRQTAELAFGRAAAGQSPTCSITARRRRSRSPRPMPSSRRAWRRCRRPAATSCWSAIRRP